MTLWLTVAVGTVVCLPLLMFPRQVLTLLFPEAEAVVLMGRTWSTDMGSFLLMIITVCMRR